MFQAKIVSLEGSAVNLRVPKMGYFIQNTTIWDIYDSHGLNTLHLHTIHLRTFSTFHSHWNTTYFVTQRGILNVYVHHIYPSPSVRSDGLKIHVFSLLLFCTIFHQTYIVNIKSKNAISAETGTVQTSYSFTFYIMELQQSQKCIYQQKCLYCDINTEVRSRIHVTIVN